MPQMGAQIPQMHNGTALFLLFFNNARAQFALFNI